MIIHTIELQLSPHPPHPPQFVAAKSLMYKSSKINGLQHDPVTQYMKILLQSLGNYYILNTVRLNGKAL